MTEWGIDTLFNPGKRHMDEEKRRLQSTREEIGDSSGGKRIDLESGVVRIARPKQAAPNEDSPVDEAETETAEDVADENVADENSADESGADEPDATDATDAGEPDEAARD